MIQMNILSQTFYTYIESVLKSILEDFLVFLYFLEFLVFFFLVGTSRVPENWLFIHLKL